MTGCISCLLCRIDDCQMDMFGGYLGVQSVLTNTVRDVALVQLWKAHLPRHLGKGAMTWQWHIGWLNTRSTLGYMVSEVLN